MDSIFIVFLVLWLVSRFVRSLGRKKGGNAAGPGKQQQAIEEQRRRLEEYQRQQQYEARDLPEHPWQMHSYDEEDEDEIFAETFDAPAPPPYRPEIIPAPLPRAVPAPAKPRQQAVPDAYQATPQVTLAVDRDVLVQGIIMAEVLGAPRARRRRIRTF